MGELATTDRTLRDSIPTPEDYDVSYEFGFLVANPLEKLPDYFGPWNELAMKLPDLIRRRLVRKAVSELSELDDGALTTKKEKLCAYTFLGFIAHAYVWQEGAEGVAKVLPRQLAVPFHSVSHDLGLPPVITYTSFALANWRFKDHSRRLHISNVESLVCHYPSKASGWFMITSWFVEVKFIPAVKAIIQALHAVADMNTPLLATNLNKIAAVIMDMKEALEYTHENLDAVDFYQSVRPYLYGWGGKDSPLPEGLIYEGVSSDPIKASGGSGAQSSTVHCLDAALGIQHDKDREAYLRSVRSYMPQKHRQFIEAIEKAPSIRNFVKKSKDADLKKAYNAAVGALLDFRSYHIQLITKYIVIQSHKSQISSTPKKGCKGTGETTVLPFLKNLRNSTRTNKLEPQKKRRSSVTHIGL